MGLRYARRIHPGRTQFCCICMFNYPDLIEEISNSKYHRECYDEIMREFHKPPQRLVPMNRGKE